jgi:hypothetical protein
MYVASVFECVASALCGAIIIYSRRECTKSPPKKKKERMGLASAFILASIYLLQHDRNVSGCVLISLASSF